MKKRGLFFFILSLCSASVLNAKNVRVGYLTDVQNLMTGYSDVEEKTGFAYEYLQNISAHTGWEYEYIYGTYTELFSKLVAGEIDLLPDVSLERPITRIHYDFLLPDYSMGSENYCLYSLNNDYDFSKNDYSSLNGKKLVIDDYSQEIFLNSWCAKNNVQFDIKKIPSEISKADLLNSGEIDLLFSDDLSADSNWKMISKLGSAEIFLAVNKSRHDILDELNSALNTIYSTDPYYDSSLWSQYFSRSAVTKKLSEKESRWILGKGKIVVGCIEGDQPYAGSNKHTGEAEGLVVHLMGELKSLFDLDIDIEYKFFESISQLYKAINNDEIDLAFPLIYNIFEAENRNISLSKKVLTSSLGYVHKHGKDLNKQDQVIAILEGRRSADFLLQMSMLENAELFTYDTYEECLDAVLSDEVDGAVFNLNQIQNVLYGRRKYNKLIVSEFSEQVPMCFAMKHQNTELFSIINKLVSTTDSSEIQNVVLSNSLNDKKYTLSSFISDYLGIIALALLIFIVIFIALMIALSYVKILINYDTLTHLLNRRSLAPYMKNAIAKAKSHDEDFSIMIFDLDNFKQINDTYGHTCGDEVLKMAADTISKGVKRGDYVFRWGGEEFLVLLKAGKDVAKIVAERIRVDIQHQIVDYEDKKISITATIGVASYPTDANETELFVKADENLYKGKNNGKNQVVAD